MKKIVKTFKGVVKAINESEKTITVIVSTESVDRDQEKILGTAFKKRLGSYKANPVLLSSHRYDELQRCIGKALSVKSTQEGLEAKFEYFTGQGNKEADWGFYLATKGIAAFSIGFLGHGYKDMSREEAEKAGYWREYTDVELMEISQVLIPSNRDAVMGRSAEAEGIEKELCEMAVKSCEFKEADDDACADVKDPHAAALEASFKALQAEFVKLSEQVKAFEEKLVTVEAVKGIAKEAIEESRHYSKALFSEAVDKDLEPTLPTHEDIAAAVRDGFNGK